jgi:GTP-binding protein
MSITERKDLRNIAIIAHVDHGKTTLVDAMLKQARVFRDNQVVAERVMDSNDLERERGITILAKNTAISYDDTKINIVDTPGHADFGGEVERVLNMVDGVLLLVDAVDGPMPQTRFVLRKALEMGHKAIVVINKIDRPNARAEWVANATFDLFIELGATDEQADFPIVHTNALTGCAVIPHKGMKAGEAGCDLKPLFELIVNTIPGPKVDMEDSGRMLVTTLAYDDYKGRIAIGRIFAGTLSKNQEIVRITTSGELIKGRIATVFTHQGLARVETQAAQAGDIIAITGLADMYIGETIADAKNPIALPPIKVEEPTVRMTFGVNTSPFAGKEGTWGTSRKLRERLMKELETNVSMRVEDGETADTFVVSGRGELHLVILIETMRREGYEFQVGKPEVIFHAGEDGTTLEPYEDVFIEVPADYQGAIMEMLGSRQGRMTDLRISENSLVSLEYKVPTRGLLGFRSEALTATRGTLVMNTLVSGYEPLSGEIRGRDRGSLVAWEDGEAITYGLRNAWERGVLFIESATPVYEGMVVGEHARPDDLDVNVCKTKVLSAVRTRSSDHDTSRLPPIRQMSLDDCIEFIAEDEMVEVTPVNIRLRKKILKRDERQKISSARAKALRDA